MLQSRTQNGCILAARQSLTMFGDDELKRYTTQVFQKAKEYDGIKGSDAIRKAMEEIGDEKLQQMTENLQRKVNRAAKYEHIIGDMKGKGYGLLDYVARRTKNLAYNIESAQRSARKLLGNSFFGRLEKEEFSFLQDKNNDLEIVRAIDGKSNVSLMAKNVAKKFADYIEYRNSEMVSSDALSIYQLNKDRFLRAVHNRDLLISGGKNVIEGALAKGKYDINNSRTMWREFIKQHLNIEKTFVDTNVIKLDGSIDKIEMDNVLNKIFDNITTDKPEMFELGKGSQRMFFYWKDMESMHTYAQQYGRKDLFANIMSDVNQSGNKVGMAQIFGDSPVSMFNELAEAENEIKPVSKWKSYNTKLTFKHLAGIDQSSVSPTLANFGSTLRTLTSMKSLGKIAFLSLPDIANGIMFAKRWGFGYWEPYTTHMSGMFNIIPSEERKYLAGVFKEMTDTHMGYVSRFVDSNNVPQVVNTASTYFFRGVGMEAIDKGNKVSSLYLLSKNLGRMGEHSWEGLPELTRKQMDKFEFGEKEWNVLRKKSERGLFTVENVEKLSDSDIRDIYGAKSNQPLYLLKNDLYRKVYSMFDVWAENAVLAPGAYMRSLTTAGTRSGTLAGELLRTVMQFKSYALQFIDRVLYQGFKDADTVQAKIGFMVQLLAATVPMSVLSMYMNNIASGRSMPSWGAMNYQEKMKYAAEIMFPSAGFLTSFFDPDKQNGDLISNALNTPSMRVLSNGMTLPLAMAGGDVKKFTKSLSKIGQAVTPGLSLPFVDPYFREIFGEKPHLQPGQVQYYGA